jgi:hypothetical protein
MLRTALILVGGLIAGFAIATWLPQKPGIRQDPNARVPTDGLRATDVGVESRLDRLEAALRDAAEQRIALENGLVELGVDLDELRAALSPAAVPGATAGGGVAEGREQPELPGRLRDEIAVRFGSSRDPADRELERLLAAGFSADRAEWITRRAEELRMQALQAQYEARREGTPFVAGAALSGEQTLRTELGEGDYERYLQAVGRPTSVSVRGVLASSPAEQAGLEPGDEVVTYGGERVFDLRDLNRLTLEGSPGEPVVVDVLRDGQRLQLVLPRGPVGITAGGRFRRP